MARNQTNMFILLRDAAFTRQLPVALPSRFSRRVFFDFDAFARGAFSFMPQAPLF